MYARTHARTDPHPPVHQPSHAPACMHVYMYTPAWVYACMHACMHAYVCMYVCMYVFYLEPLLLSSLTYDDKEKLVYTLQQKMNGSARWEHLCGYMIDKKLIIMDRKDIKLCRYPNCRKFGKEILDVLATSNTNITANDFIKVAASRQRDDVVSFLQQYNVNEKVIDMPYMQQDHLAKLCSLGNWKAFAEGLQLSKEQISDIEMSCFVSQCTSPVEEVLDVFNMRNPELTLNIVGESLRELHMNDSASVVENIISSKVSNFK